MNDELLKMLNETLVEPNKWEYVNGYMKTYMETKG
jgi:hypothetical protein